MITPMPSEYNFTPLPFALNLSISSNHLLIVTPSSSSSFKKSSSSKMDYFYKISYLDESDKITPTSVPLLNPYLA